MLLFRQTRLRSMIYLLLQRGANPNIGSVPFPPLFFAVKAGDTEAVRLLLQYGASPNARVSCKVCLCRFRLYHKFVN